MSADVSVLARLLRYAGAATALGGLAFAAAFLGYRTADPVASVFLGPLTLTIQLLGLFGGACILVLGLAMLGRSDRVA